MGKDFNKELLNLDGIYNSAMRCDTSIIKSFLFNSYKNNILCIGSGGSYSVAKTFDYFCRKAGISSYAITPMELSEINRQIRDITTVLFTASGKNNDAKNTYEYLSAFEPYNMLTVCMKVDAPIKKMQKYNDSNYYFEYQMPVFKDGYLAVESSVSSITILARAFYELTQNEFYSLPNAIEWQKYDFISDIEKEVLNKETIIVLHGGITTPSAVDLESKFSEAALGNIQLVDYRNFAHGRHNWLVQRDGTTGIIALIGEKENKIAEKTLGHVPDFIPVVKEQFTDDNVKGLLESYAYVFCLTKKAGIINKINPGNPTIYEFGRKLYHINYKIGDNKLLKRLKGDPVFASVFRKKYISDIQFQYYYEQSADYYKRLCSSNYQYIVMTPRCTRLLIDNMSDDRSKKIRDKLMFFMTAQVSVYLLIDDVEYEKLINNKVPGCNDIKAVLCNIKAGTQQNIITKASGTGLTISYGDTYGTIMNTTVISIDSSSDECDVEWNYCLPGNKDLDALQDYMSRISVKDDHIVFGRKDEDRAGRNNIKKRNVTLDT